MGLRAALPNVSAVCLHSSVWPLGCLVGQLGTGPGQVSTVARALLLWRHKPSLACFRAAAAVDCFAHGVSAAAAAAVGGCAVDYFAHDVGAAAAAAAAVIGCAVAKGPSTALPTCCLPRQRPSRLDLTLDLPWPPASPTGPRPRGLDLDPRRTAVASGSCARPPR